MVVSIMSVAGTTENKHEMFRFDSFREAMNSLRKCSERVVLCPTLTYSNNNNNNTNIPQLSKHIYIITLNYFILTYLPIHTMFINYV
jgi:hypothetical protein